jgi:hypothetical protein
MPQLTQVQNGTDFDSWVNFHPTALTLLTWHSISTAMRNQTKVWKMETGPSQGDRAWFGGPKSALFEILQNREPLATS